MQRVREALWTARCAPEDNDMRVNELLAAARSRTGLDDFGDGSFREGLERLVDAINRESKLNEFGQIAGPEMLIGQLVNRLQVEHWYRLHPEIDDEQIIAPLFGIGLPRTGSTALACMLAQDPGTRSLRTWEAGQPCPPPQTATAMTDPRIAVTRANLEASLQRCPERRGMLPWNAAMPNECLLVMFLDFKQCSYLIWFHVPSYVQWVRTQCDMESTYRYHKRVLKLLQWRCPPERWSLKSPTHMFYIDALNKVYPDARFVMTHREPTEVLPSLVELLWSMRREFLAETHPRSNARLALEGWALALRRMMEFRARAGEDRFFDIAFRDTMTDPLAEMRRLYQWLGWEFTTGIADRMSAWRSANPKGSHTLNSQDYGLDETSIRQTYRFYTEAFAAFV
jgi:Sulfotransferase family